MGVQKKDKDFDKVKEQEITKMMEHLVEKRLGKEDFDLDKLETTMTDIFQVFREKVSKKVIEAKDKTECYCKNCGEKMENKDRVKKN